MNELVVELSVFAANPLWYIEKLNVVTIIHVMCDGARISTIRATSSKEVFDQWQCTSEYRELIEHIDEVDSEGDAHGCTIEEAEVILQAHDIVAIAAEEIDKELGVYRPPSPPPVWEESTVSFRDMVYHARRIILTVSEDGQPKYVTKFGDFRAVIEPASFA